MTLVAVPATASAQAARGPVGWRSRLLLGGFDRSGQLVSEGPGLRVRTTEAGLWWDTTMVGLKAFAMVMEGDLQPNSVENGFGVFVGGRDLESEKAAYLSFQIRGDGTYLLELRDGLRVHALAPWKPHRAIEKALGEIPTHYAIRFEVRPLRIDMIVNNIKVHTIDRATVRADGFAGMRFDAGIEMNLTKFAIEPIR